MQAKLLYHQNGLRTFAIVFQKHDEIRKGLLEFAKTNRFADSYLSAIGAFSESHIGIFRSTKEAIPQDTDPEAARSAVVHRQHGEK